jgi:hypothetical protein
MLTALTMSRQAHLPGGLGVPSSNLGAPTNKIKGLDTISSLRRQLPGFCRGEALGKQSASTAIY